MKTTTIKELGPNLPIGILKDGKLQKNFSIRPYKGRTDRHLGLWKEANEGKNVGYLAAKFLSLVIEQVGSQSFPLTADGNSTPEQELDIHNWYYADVLYLYIYSRIAAVGEYMEVPWSCSMRDAVGPGKCDGKGIAKADLTSTEVRTLEEPNELEKWFTLKKGFKSRNGKLIKKVKLKPATWMASLRIGAASNKMNSVGYHEFIDLVTEVDCEQGPYTLHISEIDEIEKIDMVGITDQANRITAGPDITTTLECHKCGAKIVKAIDWSFDYFFVSTVPLASLGT